MGKFDWRSAIAGASQEIRRRSENKRAYERADEENAMGIAKALAQEGMPIPPEINIGPQMRKMLEVYGKSLPEIERKKAERELDAYENKKRMDLLYSPVIERQKPSEVQMFEKFAGMTMDEVGKLPNDMRRKVFSDWSASKRKGEAEKVSKERKQLYKGDDGNFYEYNFETGISTLVRLASPEAIAAKQAKIEEKNRKIATEQYDAIIKLGAANVTPELLSSKNALLEGTGWQIRPVYDLNSWGGELKIKDYKLKKLPKVEIKATIQQHKQNNAQPQATVPTPQAIKDPSQMTDEELAAEVERIKRGQ